MRPNKNHITECEAGQRGACLGSVWRFITAYERNNKPENFTGCEA